MDILTVVASKHGSTREIAEVVAEELRAAGHTIDMRGAEQAADVERYDAVIIGSAVYMGKWIEEARQFAYQNRARLSAVPVWLFSSGPLGRDDPQPKGDPAGLSELMDATGARDHRIFVGKLDKSRLGFGERLIAAAVKAPEGDFRDWAASRDWAREIASTLPASIGPQLAAMADAAVLETNRV